jgi:hypothetical protein
LPKPLFWRAAKHHIDSWSYTQRWCPTPHRVVQNQRVSGLVVSFLHHRLPPKVACGFLIASTPVTPACLKGLVNLCHVCWAGFTISNCYVVLVGMVHSAHVQWLDTWKLQAQPLVLSTCEHDGRTRIIKTLESKSLWTLLAMFEVESSFGAFLRQVPSGEHASALLSVVMHLMVSHSGRAQGIIPKASKPSQHVGCPSYTCHSPHCSSRLWCLSPQVMGDLG